MADISPTLSVLVADDEEGIRTLLSMWLQGRGHAVTSVGNAQEAARALSDKAFDLVVTDIVMPDGDGFELIGAVRKAQPATRIVAISGGGRYLEGSDCLKIARGLGAHSAVIKPFNWEQFREGIERAMPAELNLA